MPLAKYNGFVPGDDAEAATIDSIDPNNIETPLTNEADRIIRANANGVLPDEMLTGVDGNLLVNLFNEVFAAAATLKWSNDAQHNTSATSYTKVKEIKLNEDLPACRVSFLLGNTQGGGTSVGKVYKNGVALGTERISTSNETFTEDFTGFLKDDLIQIYVYRGSGTTAYISTFRLLFDRTITELSGCKLATPIPTNFRADPTNTMT